MLWLYLGPAVLFVGLLFGLLYRCFRGKAGLAVLYGLPAVAVGTLALWLPPLWLSLSSGALPIPALAPGILVGAPNLALAELFLGIGFLFGAVPYFGYTKRPRYDTATQDDAVCLQCGYQLRGLTEHRCPECGTPFDPRALSKRLK